MRVSHAYRRDLTKKLMRHYAQQWKDLPLPRLQLRWSDKPVSKRETANDDRESRKLSKRLGLPHYEEQKWDCFYELILPVDRYDIRNEHYEVGFIIVPISWVRRGNTGKNPPCEWSPTDTPYRDGAHAYWDSKALNWLPIFVVAPDGSAAMKADYHDAPASWSQFAVPKADAQTPSRQSS